MHAIGLSVSHVLGKGPQSSSSKPNKKQIKLVKHTFGPGINKHHPWTSRGDQGINSRIPISESISDADDSGRERIIEKCLSVGGGGFGGGSPVSGSGVGAKGGEVEGGAKDGSEKAGAGGGEGEGEEEGETATRRGDEIYYIGIIDILQQYDSRKRLENFFKGFMHDPNQISSVDSLKYAKRFISFMDSNING